MSTVQEQQQSLTVAIIGNPNTGKSTLFNSLVGAHARVGNYPGVTVEKKTGVINYESCKIELVDLPGTYSLAPRSIDEMLAVDVLLGRQKDVPSIDAVLCVVDASNLERNLYLFSQIIELGIPIVLVLNMCDVARSRDIVINTKQFSEKLGLPVISTEANKGIGIDEIQQAILNVASQSAVASPELFPKEFITQRTELQKLLQEQTGSDIPNFLAERLLFDVGGYTESHLLQEPKQSAILKEHLTQARAKLKEAGFPVPVSEAKTRYQWVRQTLDGVIKKPQQQLATSSDKIDGWRNASFLWIFVFCPVDVLRFSIGLHMVRTFNEWSGGRARLCGRHRQVCCLTRTVTQPVG